jgi:hypothetical protein
MILIFSMQVFAGEAGMVKSVKGDVKILRGNASIVAESGTSLAVSDTVITGLNSAVGITLIDGTLLSAGPKSTLSLNKFVFDSTTSKGELDATLKNGTMSVVSGKLSKTSKDSVIYRTPSTVLAVRGTEFIIDADASKSK